MSLFNRQNSTVPPELQPYYDGNSSGRGVVAWIARLGLLVILIILLVIGGVWLAHRHTATKAPAKKAETSQSKPTEKAPNNSANTKSGGSTSTNSGTSAPATSGSSGSTAPTSTTGTTNTGAQPSTTPNTGPGQTVGLFAAASAGGTIVYQVVLRRKMKQVTSD